MPTHQLMFEVVLCSENEEFLLELEKELLNLQGSEGNKVPAVPVLEFLRKMTNLGSAKKFSDAFVEGIDINWDDDYSDLDDKIREHYSNAQIEHHSGFFEGVS